MCLYQAMYRNGPILFIESIGLPGYNVYNTTRSATDASCKASLIEAGLCSRSTGTGASSCTCRRPAACPSANCYSVSQRAAIIPLTSIRRFLASPRSAVISSFLSCATPGIALFRVTFSSRGVDTLDFIAGGTKHLSQYQDFEAFVRGLD
jgi:hypothetical protein